MNPSTKRALIATPVALLLLALAGFGWVWFAPCWFGGCAPVADLERFQAEGSELLDVHGKPFATLATVNRRVVPLDSLPSELVNAFLAAEDRRFYSHHGIDLRRMGAALTTLVGPGRAEGGSTITMQLARNLFPDRLPAHERSPRRKLMEMRVARQIERRFSKPKILELYLNHIYLGEGAYGVDAAAREYFGKSASQVTLPEAATLAALPKAPSQINPREDRAAALARRNLVLGEMAEARFIAPEEAEQARAEPLRVARSGKGAGSQHAPYFVEQVRRELEERVGDRFYTAGLKIYTTLDPAAQRAAEEELARQLSAVESGKFGRYRHKSYASTKGDALETGETPYLQGAVLVLDARSGEVRAMVGGRDYADSKFNRATQAARQAGSSFKPFIYLTALEDGHSPIEIVQDTPLRLTLSGGRDWEPRNYTGAYSGPMTLRDALTRSKNAATVRLALEVGMNRVNQTARELGIQTELPSVPAAALGVADVRPIEMARAYAAFGNGGRRVEPHLVRRVEDRNGVVVWEAEDESARVLDPEVAFVLTSMLRDVVDRGTGTAVRSAGFRAPAAGKTGTTNGATDVWFVGYTPDLVGVVWMGLDRPQTIVPGASGGTLAAPVWGRLMRRIQGDRGAAREWSVPAGVLSQTVERGTGRVVGEGCPAYGPTYTEYFVRMPPRAAICPQPGSYPTLATTDTLWVDEEWGADIGLPRDTAYVAPGIDWPALDSLRDARMPPDLRDPYDSRDSRAARTEPEPPPVATPPPPRVIGTPVPATGTPPPVPARQLPPEPPADTAPAPRLLGRPVQPDTMPRVPPEPAASPVQRE